MRILVVDDSLMSRMVLSRNITAACPGALIEQATSGRQALEMDREALAAGHAYDVIFLDCIMPGMDGISTLEELRSFDSGRPVIMVTSNTQSKIKDQAESLRCTAFLSKIADLSAISALLQNLSTGHGGSLTELEVDILSESMNIGIGKAAEAMSMLIEQKVEIETRPVQIVFQMEMHEVLHKVTPEWYCCVSQEFTGPLVGEGLCVFKSNPDDWLRALLGDFAPTEAQKRIDIFSEMGSILNSTLIGAIMNLLGVGVTFQTSNFSFHDACPVAHPATYSENTQFLIATTLHANGRSLELVLVLKGIGIKPFTEMYDRVSRDGFYN
jgi:CheY-like chemotaxis protein